MIAEASQAQLLIAGYCTQYSTVEYEVQKNDAPKGLMYWSGEEKDIRRGSALEAQPW